MKRMKKQIKFLIVAMFAMFMATIGVKADVQKVGDKANFKEAIEKLSDGDVEVQLTGTITLDSLLTINNATHTLTIDLNGNNINRTNGNVVIYVNGGKVIIKDSSADHKGTVKHSSNGASVMIDAGEITLESGNYIGAGQNNKGVGFTAIQIKGGTLNVKGTANIEGDAGITVFGTNAKVNVEGGTITSKSFAISGNGSGSGDNATINSTINISGGKITSTGSAAIYHPQDGKLNITGGRITGVFGVVARAGEVKISGDAIINAESDANEEYSVGDAKENGELVKFKGGIGVVVDNTESYPSEAKVTIEGGTFNVKNDTALLAYNGKDKQADNAKKEIKVSGGKFDKKVESIYVSESDVPEVKIGGTYYVGTQAENAATNAPSGSIVEVLQGNLNVNPVNGNVTVKNNGEGKVEVNGVDVATNGTITTPSYSSSIENVEKEPEEKQTTIVEGVTFKDNGDGLVVEGNIVSEKDSTYEEMIKMAANNGYTELFNMYEFHVKDNGELGKALTITFDLGSTNNGKTACVLHKKHDNTYEKWERKVEDGKVTITVDELSPFIVALKASEVIDVPKTSSMDIAIPSVMAVMSLSGITILLKKKKQHN